VRWLIEGGIGYITAHVHLAHAASAAVARKAGLRATDAIYDGERHWALGRRDTSAPAHELGATDTSTAQKVGSVEFTTVVLSGG
jgi:hypothetical protein